MEKKLMLPANYNVMNEEEMTYTSGGDGFTAPFAVGWTIGAVISVANLIWGLDQTRTGSRTTRRTARISQIWQQRASMPLPITWVSPSAMRSLAFTPL